MHPVTAAAAAGGSKGRHPTVHRPAQFITLSTGIVVVAGGCVAAAVASNEHSPRAVVSTVAIDTVPAPARTPAPTASHAPVLPGLAGPAPDPAPDAAPDPAPGFTPLVPVPLPAPSAAAPAAAAASHPPAASDRPTPVPTRFVFHPGPTVAAPEPAATRAFTPSRDAPRSFDAPRRLSDPRPTRRSVDGSSRSYSGPRGAGHDRRDSGFFGGPDR
jgi:hypothetical protein